jgi:hypothetical protein
MSPPLGASLALALSALSLACCGGGDEGGGDGGTLPLGKEAVVEFTSPASGDTAAVNTTLGVTVLAVRKGTQAQLAQAGFEVEPEDKSSTPYYVDVRYANKGKGKASRDISVSMEDSDGKSVPTTLVFDYRGKPYEHCANVRGALAPGKSYEDCTLFLVPKDQDVGKILFVSQAADAEIKFTRWEPE